MARTPVGEVIAGTQSYRLGIVKARTRTHVYCTLARSCE